MDKDIEVLVQTWFRWSLFFFFYLPSGLLSSILLMSILGQSLPIDGLLNLCLWLLSWEWEFILVICH